MKRHRPRGRAITALEADVLRLRAFEMVLVLFYVEDLRNFILESIRATDRIAKRNRLGSKKVMQAALRILVEDSVLTAEESTEVQRLIDYRNTVAHAMHEITGDVDAFTDSDFPSSYDDSALVRLKAYRERISKGMARHFVLSLSSRSVQFEAAERAYVAEIKRLRGRVANGVRRLSDEIRAINANIASIPKSALEEATPGHPEQHKKNGTLSDKGIACCYLLFDHQASPIAVAYLMRISLRAAKAWERNWKAREVANGQPA